MGSCVTPRMTSSPWHPCGELLLRALSIFNLVYRPGNQEPEEVRAQGYCPPIKRMVRVLNTANMGAEYRGSGRGPGSEGEDSLMMDLLTSEANFLRRIGFRRMEGWG